MLDADRVRITDFGECADAVLDGHDSVTELARVVFSLGSDVFKVNGNHVAGQLPDRFRRIVSLRAVPAGVDRCADAAARLRADMLDHFRGGSLRMIFQADP